MVESEKVSQPGSGETVQSAEPGLFVIWQTGRANQDRILADLAGRFRILRVHELCWSPRMVWANFRRFYSDLNVRGVYHERNKGSGPFLAILVSDPAPVYAERETARGRRLVNAGFLEAKQLYREWSSGLGIHCGETRSETLRDVQMLFGADALSQIQREDGNWDQTIEEIRCDVAGAHGWESADQLFGVMNFAARYAVIPGDGGEPGEAVRAGATLDILTDEPDVVYALLSRGSHTRCRPPHGGRVPVVIREKKLHFGIRFPGDYYLDPDWMSALIARRVYDSAGYYRPADADLFWLLAYVAVMRGEPLSAASRSRLARQAAVSGVEDQIGYDLTADDELRSRLRDLLDRHGFCWREPRDPWASVDARIFVGESPLARLGYRYRRMSQRFRHLVAGTTESLYLYGKDHLVSRLPWIGRLRKAIFPRRATASVSRGH